MRLLPEQAAEKDSSRQSSYNAADQIADDVATMRGNPVSGFLSYYIENARWLFLHDCFLKANGVPQTDSALRSIL